MGVLYIPTIYVVRKISINLTSVSWLHRAVWIILCLVLIPKIQNVFCCCLKRWHFSYEILTAVLRDINFVTEIHVSQTYNRHNGSDFPFQLQQGFWVPHFGFYVVICFYNTKRTSRWLPSLILDNLETITYGMWRTLYTMMLFVDRNHLLIMILIYNDNFYSCFKGSLSLYLTLPLFFEIVIVVDYLEYLFYTNHNLQLSMLDIIRLRVDEINLTASLILSYPYINRPAKLNRLNIM